jgi:hypothetical protein
MIIYTSSKKYAFKDLMEIPSVYKWVNDNRYTDGNKKSIKRELLWFIGLQEIFLPSVEKVS